MSYIYSQLKGNFYSFEKGVYTIVPVDDSNEIYNTMVLDFEAIERVDSLPFELVNINIQKAIQIDLEYKAKITALLKIYIEKVMCQEIPEIPIEILEQRELLKTECNAKILALGITDFTYRKTIKGL